MMMSRRLIVPAVIALGFAAAALGAGAPPAAAAEQGRYCIAQSGTSGENSYTGSCAFSDYQQCLQAAAGTRGNCVQNIDWRGDTMSPASTSRRRIR